MKLYFFGTILAFVSHSFVLDSIVAQCPEDLNGDSQIDIKDYLQLVGKFNQSCTNPPILSFENDHSRATIGCRQGIVHKLNSGWPGSLLWNQQRQKISSRIVSLRQFLTGIAMQAKLAPKPISDFLVLTPVSYFGTQAINTL